MGCYYLNEAKETIGSGIYCNKINGRPGNRYYSCYCSGNSRDCPHNGGRDSYALHPDTRERNRVEEQIESLPRRVTVDDRQQIEDARRSYDRLSYTQRDFVRNYRVLTEAESQLSDVVYQYVQEMNAVKKVIAEIRKIPHNVTQDARYQVERARFLYNDVDPQYRREVSNYRVLEEAEKRLERDRAKAQEDIKKTIAQIRKIPRNITTSCAGEIERARQMYDGIPSEFRSEVTNYRTLTEAEKKLSKAAELDERGDEVIAKIDRIPVKVTSRNSLDVEAARRAYDALDREARARVTNYRKLEQAEESLREEKTDGSDDTLHTSKRTFRPTPAQAPDPEPEEKTTDDTPHWDADESVTIDLNKGVDIENFQIPDIELLLGEKILFGLLDVLLAVVWWIVRMVGWICSAILHGIGTVIVWILSGICNMADPHMRSTPLAIKGFRVGLPLIIGFWTRNGSGSIPGHIMIMLLVLSLIMLGSLIASYVATSNWVLRTLLWAAGGVVLTVLIGMIRQYGEPMVVTDIQTILLCYWIPAGVILLGRMIVGMVF